MSGPLGASQFMYSSAGAAGFYDHQIEQSARFDSGSSSSLSSNHFSSANRKKFTVSFWFKRSLESGSSYPLAFLTGNSNNNQLAIYEGKLYHQVSGYALRSTSLYRDFSAWYHGVYAFDIDNSTADYRLRVYINGDEVTDWEANQRSYYSGDTNFNTGTNYIGRNPQNSATHYDGYLAEFIMIEGQQLTPSSFGETKNGVWIPKNPSSLTFGSNGYHLKFEDASNLGNDSSGNNNDFTVTNMGADHQVLDSPTFG